MSDSLPNIEFMATTFVDGAEALQVEAFHAAVQNAEAFVAPGEPPVRSLHAFSLIYYKTSHVVCFFVKGVVVHNATKPIYDKKGDTLRLAFCELFPFGTGSPVQERPVKVKIASD